MSKLARVRHALMAAVRSIVQGLAVTGLAFGAPIPLPPAADCAGAEPWGWPAAERPLSPAERRQWAALTRRLLTPPADGPERAVLPEREA